MRLRPFLSYKRKDKTKVVALKNELRVHGAGGWRDLDDLLPGEEQTPGFRAAITSTTGGFIWYGTPESAASDYINTNELPVAAARKRRDAAYPLVPLFVTAGPRALMDRVKADLSARDFKTFNECNGEVRGRQPCAAFHRHVARRYVRAALAGLDQQRFTVAATAMSEPSGAHDVTLDWRDLVPERTRLLRPGAEDTVRGALANLRDGFQPKADFPEIVLDLNLPLALAMLLGYEWRVTTGLALTVRQRTGSGLLVVAGEGLVHDAWPAWTERALGGGGPTVIAVSTTADPLNAAFDAYAREHHAERILGLHVPGVLDAAGVRGLARHVASKVRSVHGDGIERHLLLAGPVSLATLVGAASNGNGPVVVPLWTGTHYESAVTVG
jgi:hypothetical protein